MKANDAKILILQSMKTCLVNMLTQARKSIDEAQAEANYHIGAMQSRYDTFKEEAQYLAAAHQIRSITLEDKIACCDSLIKKLSTGYRFESVEMGALFVIRSFEDDDYRKAFFIVPKGTGSIEEIGGYDAMCINLDAPIIKPFIGLREGDEPDLGKSLSNTICDDKYIEVII